MGTTRGAPLTLLGVLAEMSELRAENRQLKRRVRELEAGRKRWKDEARAWKWGALRWARHTPA